jgi:hypothetical protein
VIAKRKGAVMRRGLKEVWSKRTSDEQEPDVRYAVPDELAIGNEVHIHHRHWL